MQNVIGIDVSKEKLDICALFDGKTKKKIVDNSVSGFKSLHNWISPFEIKNRPDKPAVLVILFTWSIGRCHS